MNKIKENIKAFILDLDGIITETSEYHYQGWKRLAEEEGIDFSRKDNEKLRGVSRRQSLEILLGEREVSEKEKKEMMNRKNKYYQNLINRMDEKDLLPGSEKLLKDLKNRGFKLAVASSSKNARTVIDNLGINHFFDTISDGHTVENTKPAPDIFLITAEKLQVKPEACVVIEDASSGIKGANTAGMITVGVGPEERVGDADYRFDRVKDINLNKILKSNIKSEKINS